MVGFAAFQAAIPPIAGVRASSRMRMDQKAQVMRRNQFGSALCAAFLSAFALAQPATPSKPGTAGAGSPEQHYKAGDLLLFHHHWTQAEAECSTALRMKPQYPDALLCVGSAYGSLGKWDDAEQEFKHVILLEPHNSIAHNGLGWVYGWNNKIDDALREFRQAAKDAPDYARAHDNIAWALSLQGDTAGAKKEHTEAVRLYREAVRKEPNSARAHASLADTLERDNRDEALAEYRKALQLDPEDGASHASIGELLAGKHDAKGATAEYREAIGLEPEDTTPHEDLAWLLLAAGDKAGAINEAQTAIKMRPDRAPAHFTMGLALELGGDRKDALEQYRLGLVADPHNDAMLDRYSRLKSEVSLLPAGWSNATVHSVTMLMALVPSFLLFGYFRARDLYPEPARVLWATFLLGVLIIWPVLWTDRMLLPLVHLFHGPLSAPAAEAFFNAALPEEFWKFLVVVLYCARNKEFDEPMDGIVYGAIASIGFATYENYNYVASYGIGVAITRAMMAVPGHAFMGAVMGYFVGQWRFSAHKRGKLLLAYLAPVALHWLYDFPLLAGEAASQLSGHAREVALSELAPLIRIPYLVLILEGALTVWLVQRMRKQQIQMTREIAKAAAAAQGASDVVQRIDSAAAPSSKHGWLLAIIGGVISLCGGLFWAIMLAVIFSDEHLRASDIAMVALLTAIPLLIGFTVFVMGVKRIHAHRHVLPRPQAIAAAATAGAPL